MAGTSGSERGRVRHLITIVRGGEGSGHWGHEGRPGHRGGSLPGRGGPRQARPGEAIARPPEWARAAARDAAETVGDFDYRVDEAGRIIIADPRLAPSDRLRAACRMASSLQASGRPAAPVVAGDEAVVTPDLNEWLAYTHQRLAGGKREHLMVVSNYGPALTSDGTQVAEAVGTEGAVGGSSVGMRRFYESLQAVADEHGVPGGVLFVGTVHNHPAQDDDPGTPESPPSLSDVGAVIDLAAWVARGAEGAERLRHPPTEVRGYVLTPDARYCIAVRLGPETTAGTQTALMDIAQEMGDRVAEALPANIARLSEAEVRRVVFPAVRQAIADVAAESGGLLRFTVEPFGGRAKEVDHAR